jgi:hypothetical protein
MSRRRSGARRARVLAAIFITAGAMAVAATASAPAQPLYGIVPQDTPTAEDMQLMPQGGIKGIRIMVHWPTVESVKGIYDWGDTDAMVRESVRHGLEPLPFLYGTPLWAAREDGHDCRPAECSVQPPSSGATRRAFAQFAAAAVKRYGPEGDFWKAPTDLTGAPVSPPADSGVCPIDPLPCPGPPPPPPPSPTPPPTEPPCGCSEPLPIRRWQLWNEQNSSKFFAPKPDVGVYAAMVAAAGDAIHQADPAADVILGGMWGPQSARKVVVPIKQYLDDFYGIRGVAKHFDSIAVHPYAQNVSGTISQLRAARRVAKRHGDRKVGMWVTEIGWADRGPKRDPYVKGRQGQAKVLSRAMKAFERHERRYRIRGVYWYSWRDRAGGESQCSWCSFSGLRTKHGAAKPAWRAFKRVATR